jgi:GAF domain-containing protein
MHRDAEWVGIGVDPHTTNRETEVALTLAAWYSFARHQQEAERWLKLFEQRVARLSGPERELVRRKTDRDLSP